VKILVVDDSRTMRMIVVRTLRQAGYEGHEILEAEDGASGLAAVEAHSPDLILSDWNMPNMSGLEFLAELRSRESTTPFCFVTSESSEHMRAVARQAGAVGLITKPFTADGFADVLGSVVSA
jgi:two-component system, chemotaxis family, chemotaxis protein CheY